MLVNLHVYEAEMPVVKLQEQEPPRARKEEVAEVIQIATALTAGASMSYNNIGLDVEVQLPTLFSYMCARLISMPVFS